MMAPATAHKLATPAKTNAASFGCNHIANAPSNNGLRSEGRAAAARRQGPRLIGAMMTHEIVLLLLMLYVLLVQLRKIVEIAHIGKNRFYRRLRFLGGRLIRRRRLPSAAGGL